MALNGSVELPTTFALADLTRQVQSCNDCPLSRKSRCRVPGVGRGSARVMAIGQGPGIEEDREGLPFIGQAGQWLSELLERLGLDARLVYYTNLIKCFPGRRKGGDNEPQPFAIEACKKYLETEIRLVEPEIIVSLGAAVMRFFDIKGGIKQNTGKLFTTRYGPVLPILHPAGILRRMEEAPIFATALRAIWTHLNGLLPLPAFDTESMFEHRLGLDIEVEDKKIWCVGLADAHSRTAARGVPAAPDSKVIPILHNAKYDLSHLKAQAGLEFEQWEDTILQAHFLGYKPLALKKLAPIFLGQQLESFTQVVGKRRMDDIPDKVLDYCSQDAAAAYALDAQFYPELERRGLLPLYEKEKKVTRVLMDMEARGMPLSQERVKIAGRNLIKRMGILEGLLAGYGIRNPGDKEFIGRKFWRGRGRVVTTKSGQLATGKDVLRAHMRPDEKEWVEGEIEWRALDKLKSTYLGHYTKLERVHPSFNQTGTISWRFSCSNPNLQNVPKSKIVPIYQLFVAPEGWTFISADYSQIELRMLANVSGDRNMIEAYLSGSDLHSDAIQRTPVLKKMWETIDPATGKQDPLMMDRARTRAKIRNFGIAYGITSHGLAPKIEMTEDESQVFIDGFYTDYPGVGVWQQGQVQFAEERGYVETFLGRPLYVPGIHMERGRLRSHAEKQCVNLPIQGGASEIVKDTMLRANQYLVCQVHDELLYLVPKAEAEEYQRFLEKTLVDTRHKVPYTIDIHVGDTWGDIKNIPDVIFDDEEDD